MLNLINNFLYWGKTMYNNMSNNKNNNNNMQQTNLNIINKHNKSIMHILPIWLRESKPAGIARGLLGSVETDFLIEWKRKKKLIQRLKNVLMMNIPHTVPLIFVCIFISLKRLSSN